MSLSCRNAPIAAISRGGIRCLSPLFRCPVYRNRPRHPAFSLSPRANLPWQSTLSRPSAIN
jgi:hypothetical protein